MENGMPDQLYAEPVPTVSQLAVLPFLGAIEGFLADRRDVPRLRLTMHRVMSRAGQGYLQQVCAYLGPKDPNWRSKIGRAFPVTQGIMGAAFRDGCVWRTRRYQDIKLLHTELLQDAAANAEHIDLSSIAISYLAIPFLSPSDQAVLILYAECAEFNFFADDMRIQQILSMCNGFCRLFDWLQEEPLPNIRNFPLQKGVPVAGPETVYQRIQERWSQLPAPKFTKIYSFNFEG
jgi:hypothetical protein